ncbi:amino acid adenylation domain-containing protein [Nocardia sp. NEAU-G5]|uniref:Amino acid adenylation domain-containing protein n=1 Tax=Nocardia albiluteola TaxID=2842303 RepID=A0ABS6AV05_9NOCA|nr:non-ribosomal peptide synthetase [Nocardia albiluteola]MBU3061864.1 amino acid adenylation domain-containing protein [Nocardia albiluteola]
MSSDESPGTARRAAGRPRPRPRRVPAVRTLPTLLSLAVEANPGGVAVRDVHRSLTYRELDAWSTRLARVLIARGIGPEDLVAVGIERSVWSVAAVWAVAKAGAAFVPVDPNYPPDRVAHLVSDSGAVLGLSVRATVDRLPGDSWLVLDDPEFGGRLDAVGSEPVTHEDRVRPLQGAHPAYVIYTSGSTGLPKGVVVTHAGLANFCAEQRERYAVTARSRTLHFASPSFDASVLELLLAIGAGASMVIAPAEIYGGAELAELLRRERVTHAFVTPAALASVDPAGLDELAVVVAGGEACPPELVQRWAIPLAGGGMRRFHNGYGPTETTIMTNISDPLVPGEPVTIGRAIRGMTSQILDTRLGAAPGGEAGELYLAGPGLARGYHRRPGLTAARFVADPAGLPGGRMYRTGDLARTGARENVEYLGRNDFQVKIRGFRIELGEIDAALTAHPEVDFAVTLGRETPSGETILVGYVVATPGTAPDPQRVRDFVAATLPAHMVPPVVLVLDRIPLTPVGKLDRAALPDPPLSMREYRAPATDHERAVAAAIAEVLGVERVGLDDDFFALGGNSLLAVRAAARIGAELGLRVPPRLFFTADTIAELAAAVGTQSERRRPPLVRRERPDPLPVSAAQQRLWLTNQFDTASPSYNIPFAMRLTGDLDLGALRAALADVIARHAPLRTIYPAHEGQPVQRVLPVGEAVPELTPEPVAAQELSGRLLLGAAAGFDLRTDLPLRARLFRIGAREHVLAVVAHHIACDGTSLAPLARDMVSAYHSRSVGSAPAWAPLAVEYADYVLWQRDLLGDETDPESLAATQARYWRERLEGSPELLELPADRPRPALPSGRGGMVAFAVDADVVTGLRRIADAHNASLFMVAHAALAVLLARLSGTADITIGTQISGRGEPELDDLVGMFGNSLALRTEVPPGQSFSELIESVRETDLAAFDNWDLGIDRVVELVRPGHALAYAPLFQVLLMLQNFEQPRIALSALEIEPVGLDITVAKLDLSVTLTEEPGGAVAGAIDYATDLFDHATAESIARRYVAILTEVSHDEKVAIGDIQLLSASERALLASVSGPRATPGTLWDGFSAQAARTPDAVAVVFDEREWTYAEFAARVNRLARQLISAGVRPETRVAVAMRRSADMLAAVYAVLAAGGAYVPIDPDHPIERIRYILDTTRPVCVLTAGADPDLGVRIDQLDLSPYSPDPVTDADRRAPLRDSNAAYVLFTSGSTGRPKGVVITHRAVVNQMRWMREQYDLGPGDTMLHKTPFTFDASVWELFLPLQIGARLVIARHDGHLDPDYLLATARRYDVAILEFVPSLLALLLADDAAELPASLRYFSLGGEELPPALLTRVHERHGAIVDNTYGPTEATVTSTMHRCTGPVRPGSRVPIGRPIRNTTAYVLDSRLHRVPPGVPGELYLAGVQLARGYEAAAGQSAGRFVADPFGGAGTRMYRTGDRVRMGAGGELEFLGRTDFQVKLRGLRIELGEIEAALAQAPGVERAVVVVARQERVGEFLAAYLVPAPGRTIDTAAVSDSAGKRLPAYMVPHHLVVLDRLPLTPSGKLDRRALPPVHAAAGPEFREPATAAERAVAAVFAELLGTPRIGLDDNFFDLGGNSLIGMRAMARINAALGTGLGVRDLFDAPTVARLAARSGAGAAAPRPALVAGARPQRIPLSFAQRRMWFLNRLAPDSPAYNIPLAVRLTGRLDVAALAAAAGDVLGRHEALRTRYPSDVEGAYQDILPADAVVPPLTPEDVDGEQVAARLIEIVGAGFDVTAAPPFRAALLRVNPGTEPDTASAPSADPEAGDYVLVLVVHHINADGFSMGPLARDVALAYAARAAGSAPQWRPLPVQYADYALWQQHLLGDETDPDSLAARQLAYWTAALRGIPDQLDLPSDRPRPAVAAGRGATHRFVLPADLHRAAGVLAAQRHATLFGVVHTAYAVLLARLSGIDDIVVGTPIAGRGAAELDDLVGMFVNTLALRTRVDPAASFESLLAAVTAGDLAAFDHADVPFERLVEVLDPPRSQARNPLFQTMLVLQNQQTPSLDLGEVSIGLLPAETGISQFDLNLTLSERFDTDGAPAGIIAELTYATDLFDSETIAGFAGRFERLLSGAVADPALAVGDIDLLSPAERQAALVHAGTHLPRPIALVPAMLAAQAACTPDAPAVVAEDATLTYAEFAARVNRLARRLIADGVGPESMVALAMRRSLDMVVTIHAVLAAGGAYVPLNPDHPAERNRYILDTARPHCVLLGAGVPEVGEDRWRQLRIAPAELSAYSADQVSDAERRAPLRASNTAYVIFTSGSTGRPKGVMIPHGALVNYVLWEREHYVLCPGDVVLHKTPVTFDASVVELFGPLLFGARIVVARHDGERDLDYLLGLMHRYSVTQMNGAPSLLGSLLGADAELPGSLRHVLAGGEELPRSVLTRMRRRYPDVSVDNHYGPTEATVTSLMQRCTPDVLAATGRVPLGWPAMNTGVYVLDSRLRPVPPGVAGELYLTGVQLARGYRGRVDLTAERFVADPHDPAGGRMYRTGDLVRRTRAGALEYLGRTDFQVKLRGLRIELGEIEAALTGLEGVRQAAARVVTDDRRGDRLVAFVAAAADFDTRAAKAALAEHVPGYMVPNIIVALDALPVNASGKVDRKALPAPEFEATAYRAPVSEAELLVAEVLTEVLGHERIGLDDNFFELGGNSLLATRVVALLGERFGIRPQVQWLFTAATVEALAATVAAAAAGAGVDDGLGVLLPIRAEGRGVPLFCVHPMLGLAWSYAVLAESLPGRPLYGLQTPAIGEPQTPVGSIADLATRYVAAIRSVQPEGPYHLLGWSRGGVIAHAIATRLQAAGERVAGLTMLDSTCHTDPARFRAEFTAAVREIGIEIGPQEDLAALPDDRLALLMAAIPAELTALTPAQVRRMYTAAVTPIESGHVPDRFDGDIVYVTPELEPDPDGDPAEWREFVTGRVIERTLPATHATMLSPETAAALAALVSPVEPEVDVVAGPE